MEQKKNYYFVSVIIPNYNHAPYLDQRIQSVLNQTYKNFEVIILDDCSPDNGASKMIIEKYRGNPRVSHIVYNNQNSGSTFIQWNKGFQLSKGELIWIAESDDACKETFLDSLVEQFDNNKNLSFAYSDSLIIDESNVVTTVKVQESGSILFYDGIEYIKTHLGIGKTIDNASCVLFKKENALNVNRMYMDFKGGGDYMFWVLMAELGSVAHVQKPLNMNRRHSANVTKKLLKNGNNFKELRKIYEYNCAKGYLNWFRRKRALSAYTLYAYKQDFETIFIRKQVISSLNPGWFVKLFSYMRYILSDLRASLLAHFCNNQKN